jgi:hypothetical protein
VISSIFYYEDGKIFEEILILKKQFRLKFISALAVVKTFIPTFLAT